MKSYNLIEKDNESKGNDTYNNYNNNNCQLNQVLTEQEGTQKYYYFDVLLDTEEKKKIKNIRMKIRCQISIVHNHSYLKKSAKPKYSIVNSLLCFPWARPVL